jgi:hypothetical protein
MISPEQRRKTADAFARDADALVEAHRATSVASRSYYRVYNLALMLLEGRCKDRWQAVLKGHPDVNEKSGKHGLIGNNLREVLVRSAGILRDQAAEAEDLIADLRDARVAADYQAVFFGMHDAKRQVDEADRLAQILQGADK